MLVYQRVIGISWDIQSQIDHDGTVTSLERWFIYGESSNGRMITAIVRLGTNIESQPDIMGNREYDGNRMGNIMGI